MSRFILQGPVLVKSIEKVTRNTNPSVCIVLVLVMLGTENRNMNIGILSWDHPTQKAIQASRLPEAVDFVIVLSEVEVITF